MKIDDCRRINLFIGYPNVGKSNILEALSLFSVPFLKIGENLNRLVRVENKNELFYNVSKNSCIIATNLKQALLENDQQVLRLFFDKTKTIDKGGRFTNDLILEYLSSFEDEFYIIKRYLFKSKKHCKSTGYKLLLPPFGENIIDVLSYNDEMNNVKNWIKKELETFGLEYVLDKSSNSIKVQKKLGGDEVFQLPYSSIADTLQRLIFYKTAIASNQNSVLLFEEPEAHAFPPYIRTVTQDIVENVSNQFFIATHSPVIVNNFIEYEDVRQEVAIYLIDFKDEQTIAKRLSDKEVDEIYNYGEDLFFNLEKFL
ncbi:MAG: AAA family ATPase [Bacteroidales bacterium]|nr:AAA family ATPase [Bacteroidales bacterium]